MGAMREKQLKGKQGRRLKRPFLCVEAGAEVATIKKAARMLEDKPLRII